MAIRAAEPAPVFFQSGPGRFEIAAVDIAAARAALTVAEELWRALAVPLNLPAGFSTPVLVRVQPGTGNASPFRVQVEAGGIVSVRITATDTRERDAIVARALTQALLMRLAVAHHGANPRIAVPLWLEHACVGWWQVQREPARFDALQYEMGALAPPSLEGMLTWRRDEAERPVQAAGAIWLMAFLRGEAAQAGEWLAFLQRTLAGTDSRSALAASYPGRFRDETERELWWQTGWHQAKDARSLPVQAAAESRRELEALTRFVFANDGRDTVVLLRDVLGHGSEPLVRAELAHRTTALNRLLPTLHPFYRNAGLSLAAAFATATATAVRRDEACQQFADDWREGHELAAASARALDELENKSQAANRAK